VSPEFPGRGSGRLWLRFLLAGVLVVVLAAGATATAGLLQVQSFVDDIKQGGTIQGLGNVISRADVGAPQTILLIGSDHRYGAARTDARSDTMMLVHLDPDASATTVLSIPRDLKVDYTYNGALRTGAKINETYTVGGEALTAKVIKHLLGIKINHVVNINFKGFKAVVDAIGCVYADIDHHYYHSNLGSVDQYAEIDIPAGYQRLCGSKALDYVRFRHADSDFVRAARQQDFLRQAKSQYGVDRFINDPHQITKQIGKYMRTDPSLQSKEELLSLANLLAYSANHPIRQVQFQAGLEFTGGVSYVVSSPEQIAAVRHEFISPPPKEPSAKPARHRGRGGKHHGAKGPSTNGLVDASQTGEDYAIRLGGTRVPIYYPKLLTSSGQYMPPSVGVYPRKYRIMDTDHHWHDAYRLVVTIPTINGAYYGIEGTGWKDPPILRNPSADTRKIHGKQLLLYYDGSKLRTVGWKTSHASYWVQNTLTETLSNDQMLAIAGSLTRLGR
jgi:polyisoprenyl-teichoic acid--peptidoglycan teichoic acid transferase